MPEAIDRECSVEMRMLAPSDAASRTRSFICSTDALDSYGERVEQVWDLKRFLANPVILFAHNSREMPIGKASSVGVVDGKLQCDITLFSEKVSERAEEVYQAWQEGGCKAVSVGFRSHSYRMEKEKDDEVLILSDNELMEVSVVPIPANPEALAKMRAKARADATEAASRGVENAMTDEDKKKLADAESARTAATDRAGQAEKDAASARAAVATAEKALTDERVRTAALEAQGATLTSERDAAVARAEKAEGAALDAELDALIGDKCEPAEKDALVRLAKLDRSLFDTLMAQRKPLGMTGKKIPAEPDASKSAEHDDNPLVALALGAGEPSALTP